MLGCPESPVHLASKGKRAEAEEVATKLWGPGGASQLGGAPRSMRAGGTAWGTGRGFTASGCPANRLAMS